MVNRNAAHTRSFEGDLDRLRLKMDGGKNNVTNWADDKWNK